MYIGSCMKKGAGAYVCSGMWKTQVDVENHP